LDPKNINTVGRVTPENYIMSHNRLYIEKWIILEVVTVVTLEKQTVPVIVSLR
jgi:hypothetical protein